jgi:pyruvate,water dikinase
MDAELLAVPDLGELGNSDLLAVLHNGRRALGAVHGYEALAGLLIPDATAATVTGASLALSSVAQARAEGVALEDLIEHDPVVLALIAPRIGPARDFGCLAEIEQAPAPFEPDEEPEPAAVAREALRLRVRWLQELTGRAAWELGRRLVDVGLLPAHERVRMLGVDELLTAVERRVLPDDLATRTEPDGRSLPARFRVGTDGSAVPAPVAPRRRRLGALRPAGSHDDERGVGAGGGVGSGPVHIGASDIPIGSVLVVPTLDPRLAPVIPRLAGLVAETGNPLSHLAILAREHHVPVVVGLPGATTRFAGGSTVTVDGAAGSVVAAAEPAPAADPVPPAPLAEPSPTLITAGVLP